MFIECVLNEKITRIIVQEVRCRNAYMSQINKLCNKIHMVVTLSNVLTILHYHIVHL